MNTVNQQAKPAQINQWLGAHNWQTLESYFQHISDSLLTPLECLAKGMLLVYGPPDTRNTEYATVLMEQACTTEPKNVRFSNALAALYLQVGKLQDAKQKALYSCTLDKQDTVATLTLARVAWALEDRETSLENYKKASSQFVVGRDKPQIKQHIEEMCIKLANFWWQPLQGKHLTLVRFEDRHLDFLLNCRENTGFQSHYNMYQNTSENTAKNDIKRTQVPPLESKKIEWIIEKNGSPIGIAGLVDFNIQNARAEIQIGFPSTANYGNALEASLLLLEFAFNKMNLHKVISYVYSNNPNGQRNTLHLGFTQEGILKSHVIVPNTKHWLDLYINGCIKEDFLNNQRIIKITKKLLGRSI